MDYLELCELYKKLPCMEKFEQQLKCWMEKENYVNKVYLCETEYKKEDTRWCKRRKVLQQLKMEHQLGYFVYIKFAYNTENKDIKPLVVGMTHIRGKEEEKGEYNTDINFGLRKSGLARNFLNTTECLTWYKEKMLILPSKDKTEAIHIEKGIREKFYLLN